ncbi:NAD(P)-dependent oxidoreductase [Mycobacterium nebraskense]|uniref:Oxidoreductase n=1 Tax=Mycobacterium nebraskense TaxID=244292 RepID=A0A0F5NJC2_9MYCO|nr:NAD(P)-dependent oxidoreductase [Mycobacterium nebraskense]KKC06975.1 oxidoreductase [Mycobacterium nebraskense]KLO46725.1 oxidoreductase [Mycobacterium nebraskense]MBI2694520.1 NAD(P)-dependent oxidoreductase [Mycobacterium nebraskense]MCV7118235.1 NAD(P)-dependent oxidoreductase [Mycobacterium nebraskense]ORW27115.1 oxidoreductase [Mycobacterium nebraskense]
MEVGFIGLGNMGFPMARRLIQESHDVVAFDTRGVALDRIVALGARPASSPKEVADRTETVMASLPTPSASLEVATGAAGVIQGARIKRYVDLSTVGSRTAVQIHDRLAERNIVAIDSPVSGGVGGAEKGALAVMVSGPRDEFDVVRTALEAIGRPFYVGDKPGSAQTMKLANNILAANVLAATAEVVVMGVKAGLDPGVMIEVLNAGSGATSASRDKFPRAILPRTFDYGFATGLMVKDVHLYLDEAEALGVPTDVAATIGRLWEAAAEDQGLDSDFTTVIKPLEKAAGVTVGQPSA